ncbi:FecR family protein [Sphingobacterium humi]|uniref:DUF4974 domain-containing protein n=1 Tax=Sphingobacterium humi TaxID=1796905 RepID=A0A6N8L052_9SPHI|nr:FecR family protein [Sphingobacterium humi]MVZ63123.1 DUF4974 domain-containing protein [Sphingobacterium humi]
MSNIQEIYQRFITRQCSIDEAEVLMEHFRIQENEAEILNLIQKEMNRLEDEAIDSQDRVSVERNWIRLDSRISRSSRLRRHQTYWLAGVACLLLFAAGTMLYFYRTDAFSFMDNIGQQYALISPGSNKATLTLSDGTIIALSEEHDGMVVDEQLMYDDGSAISSKKVTYGTLTTPRGGQYRITLADGTKVWLNAESSLKYPTKFNADERVVTLEGEAYFEVKSNAQKPFIVYSYGQRTMVKGTKFNMSAYQEDKKITTTLLEGEVGIQLLEGIKSGEILLKPDEQAVVFNGHITKKKVDAYEVIAWSKGKFMFTDTPLPAIMSQIERWYDVEVMYAQPVNDITFTGSISRFEDIQDVLRKLTLTEDIEFEIQERRIMVKRE